MNETKDSTKAPKDYKKTNIRQAAFIFEQFIRKMENEWKGKLIEQSGKFCIK